MSNQIPFETPGSRPGVRGPGRPKIRILVVDDSVVIRRFLAHALNEEPGFEVVGFAVNGAQALTKAAELKPDVITLDIEMPEMDGLETVRRLRQQASKACVIMCSTLTSRGASATIDALVMGANDYVTKPCHNGPMEAALKTLTDELVPKIRQFFDPHLAVPRLPAAAASSPRKTAAPLAAGPHFVKAPLPKIVAIGVSTGGPTALMEIMRQFPASFPLPVVIVQHMPPLFTKLLADRLNDQCSLEVMEASAGLPVKAGRVVIAPGDFHMRLRRSTSKEVSVVLDQGPQENSCRPAVDVLFRSVGELYDGAAIGVILTGMGQDGLHGVEQLKSKGAYIVAQDRSSSVVWGMPGAVVEAGLADAVLGLREVVPEIFRQVAR
ncbi:Chemotaxis response regulator protein-glutamate methylesterase CheB [Acidisarcina polymorpha]|uniref:Protein-glutamate methylesterase/protein-glutamine glutaminase n=1 Tax=Acidisarcina polymorpha TaxID=2211140 RepID=A0A2Z5G160_9BACT|nr:chemotaxis response regulator protein-glutamate methylesterase [Acidisarcina polymorpha]AXC12891.1 Chemotaxis response regulator protein-glutamate methylesterase CheB [Acidisarcina polymorpha]